MIWFIIYAAVFTPDAALEWSMWYLNHIGHVIIAAFAIDVVIWSFAYRRYRRKHPYEPVTLMKIPKD